MLENDPEGLKSNTMIISSDSICDTLFRDFAIELH